MSSDSSYLTYVLKEKNPILNSFEFIKNWNNFALNYQRAIFDSFNKSVSALENPQRIQDYQKEFRRNFDSNLRQTLKKEDFTQSLFSFLNSYFSLIETIGANIPYYRFNDFFSSFNKFLEPIRDTAFRTSSEVIPMDGKFNLLHYKSEHKEPKGPPLLVVYSLINRHYILDLLPQISIIRHFLDAGFDVYATDWGTPDSFDNEMSFEKYTHENVEKSVEKIKELTGSEKVSLFGYCWGGIFSLIYSAMHPESVNAIVLHATPVDLNEPDTVIEKWTKNIDADKMVKTLGNVPGSLLNMAFIARNPLEAWMKYYRYFIKPRSFDEIQTFFAIETWLYDSRPMIGQTFKDIIDEIYKDNSLIKNQLKIGEGHVDLKKISMPLLNIYGKKDDLVPPSACKTLMGKIASSDKKIIEFPTGHVGLCISKNAHKNLWPQVAAWLKERSYLN